jgi:hypothetical protein
MTTVPSALSNIHGVFLIFWSFSFRSSPFSSSPILSTARDDDQKIIPILIVVFAMALKKT